MRGKTAYSKHQRGTALVLVLWMLAILIILANGYSRMMRTDLQQTANMVNTARAEAAAEAGIHDTILRYHNQ